jgi:hypothetical protein
MGKIAADAVKVAFEKFELQDRAALFSEITARWCPYCGIEQKPGGCWCERDE